MGLNSFFDDDTWLMIRPSGTEPVLRTYVIKSSSKEKCFDILEEIITKNPFRLIFSFSIGDRVIQKESRVTPMRFC